MRILASPRARRRLAWALLAAAAAGVAIAGIVLLPDSSPQFDRETAPAAPRQSAPASHRGGAAAAPARPTTFTGEPRRVKLTPADRRELTSALDRFILAGVAGGHPEQAWELVTPAFKASTTRADWRKGETPFWRFPARGTHFDGWVLKYSYPGDVGMDIFLQPRPGADTGPISFRVELKKTGGRWLVETWQPMAMFSKPGEPAKVLAQPDLAPGLGTAGEPRISANWLFLPLGLLAGAIVLIPLAVALTNWRKNRAVVEYLEDVRTREGRAI